MNGIAALLMWQKFGPVTYFRIRLPGMSIPITNALVWTLVALGYMVLASMAAGNEHEHDADDAAVVSRLGQREHRAGYLHARHDGGAGRAVRVPLVVRAAGDRLDRFGT